MQTRQAPLGSRRPREPDATVPVRRRDDRPGDRPDPRRARQTRRCTRHHMGSALGYVALAEQASRPDPASGAVRLRLGRRPCGTGPPGAGPAHRQPRDQRDRRRHSGAQGHQLPHASGQSRMHHGGADRLLRAREQPRARLGHRGPRGHARVAGAGGHRRSRGRNDRGGGSQAGGARDRRRAAARLRLRLPVERRSRQLAGGCGSPGRQLPARSRRELARAGCRGRPPMGPGRRRGDGLDPLGAELGLRRSRRPPALRPAPGGGGRCAHRPRPFVAPPDGDRGPGGSARCSTAAAT